jgi:Tfp pilus assembly protein PilV
MLIEVLVSVSIFVFGILSLAGVHANAIQSLAAAKNRMIANQLAGEVLSMLWVGNSRLAEFAHHPISASNGSSCDFSGAESGHASDASSQLFGILKRIETALPNASAERQQIVVESGGQVRVTICWREPSSDDWQFAQLEATVVGKD